MCKRSFDEFRKNIPTHLNLYMDCRSWANLDIVRYSLSVLFFKQGWKMWPRKLRHFWNVLSSAWTRDHAGSGDLMLLICSSAAILCRLLNPPLVKMRKTLNSPLISSNCHTMPFFESPPPLVLPSSIYLPLPNPSSSTPPLLPLPQLHLRSISLSLFFPLLPCDRSHFLTLPRASHTQPFDDPQTDPR